MLVCLFKTFLLNSLLGSFVALILIVVRPITRKHFSSRWHYYIWLIVLLIMIVPFRFVISSAYDLPVGHLADLTPLALQIPAGAAASDTAAARTIELVSVIQFLSYIWFIGGGTFFLFKVVGYFLFCLRLRKNSIRIPCPEISLFTRQSIIVRTSSMFLSPSLLGLVSPTLLLPETQLTKEQLYFVLAHEMTHYKRKDVLYKWFVCLVVCVHWFNPVIYYISRQISTECEISCDLAVVAGLTREQEHEYMDAILTLLSAKRPPRNMISTAMSSNINTLKRRFTMIKNKPAVTKRASILSAILAVLLLVGTVFASGAANGALIDEPKESSGKNITAAAGSAVDETSVKETPNTFELSSFTEEFVWPCEGQISMTFGSRTHPITEEVKWHNGVDIAATEGMKVCSAITGIVTDIGFDPVRGNYLVVTGDYITTTYSHLAETVVRRDDNIISGQVVGSVGMTGQATGPHLHFEVITDDEYRDPLSFIK